MREQFQPSEFEETYRQIVQLMGGDEADEYGILKPTQFAFERVTEVLSRAYSTINQRGHEFPRGSVTTDETGGIRIEWFGDDRAVRLAIPANKVGHEYIYHERGNSYGTVDVTGRNLADWLQRLF